MDENVTQNQTCTIMHDGKTRLIHRDELGVSVYEVVEEFPLGYTFWNIGIHAPDGYIPLCRPAAVQPFPGSRRIDETTLKAIKADGVQIILRAMHYEPKSLANMKKVVENASEACQKNKRKLLLFQEALPYLEKIPGIEYWSDTHIW